MSRIYSGIVRVAKNVFISLPNKPKTSKTTALNGYKINPLDTSWYSRAMKQTTNTLWCVLLLTRNSNIDSRQLVFILMQPKSIWSDPDSVTTWPKFMGDLHHHCLSHLQMVASSETAIKTEPSRLKTVCRMAAEHLLCVKTIGLNEK